MTFAFRTAVLALLAVLVTDPAPAQRRGRQEVENLKLTTRDGVELAITFYPGEKNKETAPVVILHDVKETRQRYADLAKLLANDGNGRFSVVTVDLRGHGESVTQTQGNRQRELNASKLRTADYAAMIQQDLESVRRFLEEKNDQGDLNLDRLSLVGIGMGAAVALNYTALDWSIPKLATRKQGQYVKSLVLVSPRWKQQMPVNKAVQQPDVQSQVAVLMLYGAKDRRVAADVKRIHTQLERGRETPAGREKLTNLMKVGATSELQGAEWLRQAGSQGEKLISDFLTKFSLEPDYPHAKRKPEF